MMTRPPAPDDRPLGNGHPGHYQRGKGQPGPAGGADPLGAQRARLAAFWLLVLRRFRGYAQGNGEPAAGRERDEEGI